MRQTADPAPAISLDRRHPAYREIYERFRQAILSGSLGRGARLPSARTLAAQLGLARGTVDAAYGLLANEGYVVTRGAAGTVVDPALDRRALSALGAPPAAVPAAPATTIAAAGGLPLPFQMGMPALDAFPRKAWSRLVARHGRAAPEAALPEPAGLPRLRREIATYLGVARGVVTAPENILVTGGFQGALGLVALALLRPGERVWMEEPGYFMTRRGLLAAGARPVDVPVDADGLRVREGIRRAPRARLAVVTPSHQSPLGVTLSLARRLELLSWARRSRGWILEDDYDGEFRYLGPPLPALRSLDREGRVLYAGTFSKVLLPSLRLGYLVVPDGELARFREVAGHLAPAPASLLQSAVADFMAEGQFARHIRRMRALYAERRAAVAAALGERFGPRLRIELQAGGMHLLAWPAGGRRDSELVARAEAAGLAPSALSQMSATTRQKPGLLLGFANTPAARAGEDARRLADALGID
ncbi:MAG TPA: PLP-dependent aminotransferase family protein [Stellaceae bacterium]|nr:PLP-dependent aminotransferase family protein [Stellaceae bacterium]